MDLKKVAATRYSTKVFDPEKTISDRDMEQIKALLRLSPSSVNSQPWHFIIAGSPGGKARISKGTQGFYQFNEAKIKEASHAIVFCARTRLDDDYLDHLLATEDRDGRFADQASKQGVQQARGIFADIHRYDLKDLQHWMEKQVYLNMGTLLLGAAVLGIDAVPMEGIDVKALDEEFNLREKGYTAVAVISLGFARETDFNAALPKSRLPEDEIFTVLD